MTEWLRYASVAAWLVPLVLFAPSVWRVLRGRKAGLDTIRAGTWLTAALCVGFASIWIIYGGALVSPKPGETAMRNGLYVLSIILAFYKTACLADARYRYE